METIQYRPSRILSSLRQMNPEEIVTHTFNYYKSHSPDNTHLEPSEELVLGLDSREKNEISKHEKCGPSQNREERNPVYIVFESGVSHIHFSGEVYPYP